MYQICGITRTEPLCSFWRSSKIIQILNGILCGRIVFSRIIRLVYLTNEYMLQQILDEREKPRQRVLDVVSKPFTKNVKKYRPTFIATSSLAALVHTLRPFAVQSANTIAATRIMGSPEAWQHCWKNGQCNNTWRMVSGAALQKGRVVTIGSCFRFS